MSFDLSSFRLNSSLGKLILAATREGNYAHPGEEEAIIKTLQPLAANPSQNWLDAGCGRGGTAAFIKQKGWANVTAFDIDGVSIAEARTRYPAVSFHECGVLNAQKIIPGKFDLIYSFNAFYAFPEQAKSLCALRALSCQTGRLVLFDYIDRGGFYDQPLTQLSEGAHWRPVDEGRIADQLPAAGWKLETVQNLDQDYARWYEWLLARFDARHDYLTTIAPPEAIDYARNFYSLLLDSIRAGSLGGGIFLARAISSP